MQSVRVNFLRWTHGRKATVIEAVLAGRISRAAALSVYAVTETELAAAEQVALLAQERKP